MEIESGPVGMEPTDNVTIVEWEDGIYALFPNGGYMRLGKKAAEAVPDEGND